MIDSIPWSELITRMDWRQGEHVTAIAPTGAGKTSLFKELMPLRKRNIMFGTKKRDTLYSQIIDDLGFVRLTSIREAQSWMQNVIIWPEHHKTIAATEQSQKRAFKEALDRIAYVGAWTIWVDEAKYIAEKLRLNRELTFMLEQIRSANGTIISGAQRPAWLPVSALSNATHIFLWKTTHDADVKRLADIGGINSKSIHQEMQSLGEHEFIYIKTRGTQANVYRSQIPYGKVK